MSPTVHRREEFLDQVSRAVRRQLQGRLHDFEVWADRQGLILSGRVRSYYAKQLAQHVVMQQTDSLIVRNEIAVIADAP